MKVIRKNCEDKNPITIRFCCAEIALFCSKHKIIWRIREGNGYIKTEIKDLNSFYGRWNLRIRYCFNCGAKIKDWPPGPEEKDGS